MTVGAPLFTLEEVTERLIDYRGKTPPKTTSGIRLITAKVIKRGQILSEPAEYIAADFYDEWMRRGLPQELDVLITTEAPLGEVALLRGSDRVALAQRVILLRANTKIVDPVYLFFALQSDFTRSELHARATGTTVAGIKQSELRQVRIFVPPLPVQRRIASILSAYDDLIENCERRIRVLDEMARALYREWFVLFRYPGHEKTPLVDSPMGRIPKGWTIARLGSLTTKIGSGSTPRGGKESYQKQGMSLIRSLNVYDDRFELSDLAFIDEAQARQLDNVEVKPCDVLLNITGASVARCTMVPTFVLPARVNQHVAIVRADATRLDPYFLLDTINSVANKSRLLALAQGGATREALTKETISSFEIILPPLSLIRRYGEIAATSGTERETLRRQIENLRKSRDLLLPRLLSGQLPVEDLHEAQLEESS